MSQRSALLFPDIRPEPLPPDAPPERPPAPEVRLTEAQARAMGVNVTVATFVHLRTRRKEVWLLKVSYGLTKTVTIKMTPVRTKHAAEGGGTRKGDLPELSINSSLRLEPGAIVIEHEGWRNVVDLWIRDMKIDTSGMDDDEIYYPPRQRTWTARR